MNRRKPFSSPTLKRYIHLFPFLFIIIPLVWSWYLHGFHQNHDESDKIMFCKNLNKTKLNYIGSSLISNSHDSEDQVFCPGDYFGDLNSTYVTIKSCSLEMYHKEKLLWSSKSTEDYTWDIEKPHLTCAFSLQRDGNLVLYREITINKYLEGRMYAGGTRLIIFTPWEARTNLNPAKTELRIKDQRMQILQTFKDGTTERLFYVDQNNQGLQEDIGEPKKIANRFVVKKFDWKSQTILERNEYIGDLDGIHLILQTNCSLQLLNKNKTLWSFGRHFRPEMSCSLGLDYRKQVAIFIELDYDGRRTWYTEEIMWSGGYYRSYELEETLIMFEDDQPIVIQTLKNGTELTFIGGGGPNHGLKLKRNLRKLAEKTVNISKDGYKIERMDYIGNLTGLHLILGQDCDLKLLNNSQKLWELQPPLHEDLLLECSLQFDRSGNIRLEREYASLVEVGYFILTANYDDREFFTGYQLTLENNQLIVARHYSNRPPDMFLAGLRTRGTLFQIIAEHSVMVHHDDKDDRVLPKMGFIGELNGVYVMLEENCSWVLYNKTQVIWESGITGEYCIVILKRNRSVEINHEWEHRRENPFWSTYNITIDPEKQISGAELLVNNDGLWFTNTYSDGTVKKFRALEGTNNFIHVSNESHL